ncbi:hypothetical protein ACVBEH_33915, partial [Roseateles sp. GG27B]
GGLALKGDATYTLTNTGNQVGSLAIDAGRGTVSYVNAHALAVATVNGIDGITHAANVVLRNVAGDMNLAKA